jgi:hypothetical protein
MLVLSVVFHLYHSIKYSSSSLNQEEDDEPKHVKWYQLPRMSIVLGDHFTRRFICHIYHSCIE